MEIFHDMIGKVFVDITGAEISSDMMTFHEQDGSTARFVHYQDCCESVSIAEIIGDISDLINSPILMAEEIEAEHVSDNPYDKWTFYKFATIKGYVTVRWLSNEDTCYSTSISYEFEKG